MKNKNLFLNLVVPFVVFTLVFLSLLSNGPEPNAGRLVTAEDVNALTADQIKAFDGRSRNMLHQAIRMRQADMVKLLIEKGVNLNAYSSNGDTYLFYTLSGDKKSLFKILVEAGADVSLKDTFSGDSLLHRAIGYKIDVELIDMILAKGVRVDVPDKLGNTALHESALYGFMDAMEYLIGKKADVNAKNEDGDTPLHLVCLNQDVEYAVTLINAGADVKAADSRGLTPLHLSVLNDRDSKRITELLLKNGADANAKDKTGRTPLMMGGDPVYKGEIKDEVKTMLRNAGAK